MSMFLFGLPLGFVVWVWGGSMVLLGISFVLVLIPVVGWVRDVITEGTFSGLHSGGVLVTVARGMMLFIASEAIFFFAFFWGWAHNAWAPSIYRGGVFPSAGVAPVHPMGLPFFNLARLVWRSGTVNLANGYLRMGKRRGALWFLGITILLGAAFEMAQLREYQRAAFGIRDGVFGRSFFLLTGFHGAHVMGGMGFLFFNWVRLFLYHFHYGFNVGWVARVWYWHFVDVIWVFLWVGVYGWGGWGHYSYLG